MKLKNGEKIKRKGLKYETNNFIYMIYLYLFFNNLKR